MQLCNFVRDATKDQLKIKAFVPEACAENVLDFKTAVEKSIMKLGSALAMSLPPPLFPHEQKECMRKCFPHTCFQMFVGKSCMLSNVCWDA